MNRRPSEVVVLAVSLAFMFVLAACNSSTPVLRYIVISPATATITTTTTQQYTATGYYSNGAITPGISVTWASTNTAVATIDPVAGVATAVAVGTTMINAYASGITATSATLNVNGITALTISPLNQTIASGATEQFDAMATFKNADGTTSTTDVTSQVTWTSSNTNAITINSSGLATSVGPNGMSQISAALDGLTAMTSLTVGPPVPVSLTVAPPMPTSKIAVGNAMVLTATENWSDGTTGHTPTAAITWSSDTTGNANVVPISANTASLAGFGAGMANITASEALSSPITGTLAVTVAAGTAHYAYVSNSGTNATNPFSIGEYTVTATTTPYLTSLGTVPTTGFQPQQTVLDPNGQYLYMIATSGTGVTATLFTVNTSTGALTAASSTPTTISGTADVTYGIIDPYGRFLYVADLSTSNVYAFQINQTTGVLTAVTGSPFSTNVSGPISLIADHSGQYLYVINTGSGSGGTISGYTIDQTMTATGGALTPFTSNATIATTGTAPSYSTLDPTGTYIYVPDSAANTVTTFAIGSGGALTNKSTTTAIGTASALWNVAVDPSGKYLYVLDQGNTSVTPATNGAVYQFNLTSGIPGTAPVGSAVSTGVTPNGIVVDPSTSLVAVENFGDDTNPSTISLFTIGTGGALTAQAPVTAGVGPLFVIFYDAP
jgi:6-phosphogluconolactonase (cycloisomerase 2 family)